ncbi:MAG: VapC toxin family PIN domain ribonuclease [Candidatus Thorarchaeota archaeon]|nr:MAG: VapC toxin family PIN domain ribonuclease [Candidatus Thorarchaeota archaeon]
MLIENDMILAFYKKNDNLKTHATRLFSSIEEGKFGSVLVPSIFSIELYYVLRNLTGVSSVRDIISHVVTFPNISVVPSTIDHQLAALYLLENYRLGSIFDAIYAAVSLSNDNPDHTIASTDRIYDRIEGLTRLDPTNI